MSKSIGIIKYAFVIFIFVFFTITGCASTKKSVVFSKKNESLCDLSHLGKNKYFYSASYQRRLTRSTKKIASH